MTLDSESSLAEQRQFIRGQLRTQRQKIAEQLAPDANAQDRYPRSVTMRLLIDQPNLPAKLITLISSARFADSIRAILVLVPMLRSAIAVNARKPLNAPSIFIKNPPAD